MPVDFKIANHTCNVIKRHIKSAFPDLDIIFVVHGEHERKKAFQRESAKIMEHPAGHFIVDYMRNDSNVLEQQRSRFAGLAKIQNHGFLGFFRENHTAPLIFINHDRFSTEDNLRNHALHLIWHAISFSRDLSNTKGSIKPKAQGFIAPDISDINIMQVNLCADIFSACFQKLQGKEDSFDSLITVRMLNTLGTEKGFIAENFPFPICFETLEIVLEDQFEQSAKKFRHVSESIKIAHEIGQTYKPASLMQWAGFAKPAQEMAWCGFDKETILGCAIYSSENTYVRSIADMVAERLDIRPAIITGMNDYNPFTETEANERLHNKQIQESLRLTLTKIYSPDDFYHALKDAKAQNTKLLGGNPIGWCAHAMIALARAVKNAPAETSPDDLRAQATQVFDLVNKTQNYEKIHDFTQAIFNARRDGHLIEREYIETHLQTTPQFIEIVTAITQIWDIDKENPIDKMGVQNFSTFVSPNALR